jgi:hypothetical protein
LIAKAQECATGVPLKGSDKLDNQSIV